MKHRFARPGPLAIETSAFAFMFDPPPLPSTRNVNGLAVVPVRGPLDAHEGGWTDSYDAIRARVTDALSAKPKAVVLAIDSPGGVMSGCLELAAELKMMCAQAGVPLVSYVDGKATSAAYALACAGTEIVVPPTGVVGSIGTIAELVDQSALDAAMGVKIHVIASGARKADGHPHLPTSEGALAAVQTVVSTLADLFFLHVAAHRPITVDEVRALEAGLLVGAHAERAGLADRVETMGALVARLSGVAEPAATSNAPAGASKDEDSMNEDEKKARASLQAICDDEKADAKAKARAKAALAAMDSDEDEKKDEDAKGEDAPPPSDEKKDEDAKAIAARAEATALRAERKGEVRAMLAERPDLTVEQRAAFADLEPKALAKILASMPRKAPVNPAASATVPVTLGAGQGGTAPAPSTDPAIAAMDRVMGLAPKAPPVRRTEDGVVFGALSHEQAAELAKNGVR